MTTSDEAPDATATAVGWIAIEAARVEGVAGQLVAALLGTDRALPVVVAQGWAATKESLEVLIRERASEIEPNVEGRIDLEYLRKMRDAVRRAHDLMSKRANVVHALWYRPDTEGRRQSVTLKRWGKYRATDWTLEELEGLRRGLRAAFGELEWYFAREASDPLDLEHDVDDYLGGSDHSST